HSAGVAWRRSFIRFSPCRWVWLSPTAGGSAGASAPVGLLAGGGGPVVEDLLHVALGDRYALAIEGAGQLAGGGPGAKSGQAAELVGAERGQVRLDLMALGQLRQVPAAVTRHGRLAALVELRRRPAGHLPGGACWPVQAGHLGVADEFAVQHIGVADDAVRLQSRGSEVDGGGSRGGGQHLEQIGQPQGDQDGGHGHGQGQGADRGGDVGGVEVQGAGGGDQPEQERDGPGYCTTRSCSVTRTMEAPRSRTSKKTRAMSTPMGNSQAWPWPQARAGSAAASRRAKNDRVKAAAATPRPSSRAVPRTVRRFEGRDDHIRNGTSRSRGQRGGGWGAGRA